MKHDTKDVIGWNRELVTAIERASHKHGISVTKLSGDWLLILEKNGLKKYVIAQDLGLNNSSAKLIARDKTATFLILDTHNIPAVAHHLFLRPNTTGANPNGNQESMTRFFRTHAEDIVCKPNDGGSGVGVVRVQTESELKREVEHLFADNRAIAFSPFININSEYRVTMLDGKALLMYEKRKTDPDELLFNLSKSATAHTIEDHATEPAVLELATKAASALGIRFANIDVVRTIDDTYMVLEVNSGVMLEHYAHQGNSEKEHIYEVYERAVHTLFQE